MRIYELSPRLRSVADLVPRMAKFADIGTDHAYLPVWLLLQGWIESAVVSDLREGPLDRARQNAEHYGVTDRISFRLGSGLDRISPEEVDAIAVAGMGGETIAGILADAPWVASGAYRLILQPMTAQEELRVWLSRNSYQIEREILTQEGRTIYLTLLVSPGKTEPLSLAETWAGRQHQGMDAPLRQAYLEGLIRRAVRALDGAKRSAKPEDTERAETLTKITAGLCEMKKEWETWQR